MPDFPGAPAPAPQTARSFTVRFLDPAGDVGSTSLSGYSSDVTSAELADVRTALGNMSNAAVISTTNSLQMRISKALATAYDEAYANVEIRLVLVFENSAFEKRTVTVPAPDASFFQADGITLDPENTQAAALISALLVVFNKAEGAGPAGDYAFLRGYLDRGRGAPSQRVIPQIAEPGEGDLPPEGPGE